MRQRWDANQLYWTALGLVVAFVLVLPPFAIATLIPFQIIHAAFSMTYKAPLLVAYHAGCCFEIVEDLPAGFYVFRYEGTSRYSTHDYLQDDLAMAKAIAHEEWEVPQEAWQSPAGAAAAR